MDGGAVIVKFYFHITKDEQLVRFKRREADPYKSWKISDEDWRNRGKWDEHNAAAEEMFERTSSLRARRGQPGVAGNYKWHARLVMLREIIKALEAPSLVPSVSVFAAGGRGKVRSLSDRGSRAKPPCLRAGTWWLAL